MIACTVFENWNWDAINTIASVILTFFLVKVAVKQNKIQQNALKYALFEKYNLLLFAINEDISFYQTLKSSVEIAFSGNYPAAQIYFKFNSRMKNLDQLAVQILPKKEYDAFLSLYANISDVRNVLYLACSEISLLSEAHRSELYDVIHSKGAVDFLILFGQVKPENSCLRKTDIDNAVIHINEIENNHQRQKLVADIARYTDLSDLFKP